MVNWFLVSRRAWVALVASAGLVGCVDYLDRKDTIAFSAGDSVQTNVVTHVPDPWPRYSRNKNIAFNGQRMQRAVERYRTNKTYPLRTLSPSAVYEATKEGGAGQ